MTVTRAFADDIARRGIDRAEAPRDPERGRPRGVPPGARRARAARPARARRQAAGAVLRRPRHQPRARRGSSTWRHGCRATRGSTSCSSARAPRRTRSSRAPASCGSRNVTFLAGGAARGGAGALPRRRRVPGAAARGAAVPLLHPVEDVRDPGLRPARSSRRSRARRREILERLGRRPRGAARGRGRPRGRRHAARGRSRAARGARRARAALRRGALRPAASRRALPRDPRERGSGRAGRRPYNPRLSEEPAWSTEPP